MGGVLLRGHRQKVDREYRIQMNRIMKELVENESYHQEYFGQNQLVPIQNAAFKQYDTIVAMLFLPVELSQDATVVKAFYGTTGTSSYEIMPVVVDNEVKGYIQFQYKKQNRISFLLLLFEGGLFLVYLFGMSVFIYIYYRLLRPFYRFSQLPMELAKGNLEQTIIENKSKYFGKFIWGIGMLKDSLDHHKRKEFTLLKEKKLLLISLSHDIKTPLNAITLYAKALLEDLYETKEEKQQVAEKIIDKTKEIDTYLKQIVTASTQDIVSIEIVDGEYYMKDLLDKVQESYHVKLQLHKVQFEIQMESNTLLKGDMERTYEAIGNIIENALKYGDGQWIRIYTSEEEYCQLIHIQNSGTPVAEKDLIHLFDSFYRGNNVEGKEGNGLGLYICQEIMRKMNGDIYVERLDEGMEFVLVCPCY